MSTQDHAEASATVAACRTLNARSDQQWQTAFLLHAVPNHLFGLGRCSTHTVASQSRSRDGRSEASYEMHITVADCMPGKRKTKRCNEWQLCDAYSTFSFTFTLSGSVTALQPKKFAGAPPPVPTLLTTKWRSCDFLLAFCTLRMFIMQRSGQANILWQTPTQSSPAPNGGRGLAF